MKRPRAHEIDDEAQDIFRAALPKSWVCGQYEKDYGKDYYVELVDNGELTGGAFSVQLKGKKHLTTVNKGRQISFPLETKYIRYFAEKVEMPVFLVVADVTAKRAYWLFVQEYVDNELDSKKPYWRQHAEVALRIPIDHSLEDNNQLREAVDSSLAYMKRKYPGTIEDSIAHEKKRLEKLDPRLAVNVGVADGKVVYTMQPKEPIDFTLSIAGHNDSVAQKYRELIEQGTLVDLSEVNASVHGLPAMSPSDRILQAQYQQHVMMEVRITLLDKAGSDLETLDPVVGQAVGGTAEMRFKESLGQSILNVHAKVMRSNEPAPGIRVQLTFSFDMWRWGGKSVSTLPYFDQVASFVRHLNAGGSFRCSMTVQGNPLFDIPGGLPIDDAIREVGLYCEIFTIAREISKWSRIDPIVPDSMPPDQVDDLFKLADLLDPNRTVVPYPNKELILEIPCEVVRAQLDSGKSMFGGHGTATLVPDLAPLSFLGVPVEVCGFSADVSEVIFQQTESDMRAWLDSTSEPIARVVAVSTPTATLTKSFSGIRRL
jgi:hypothetical protein